MKKKSTFIMSMIEQKPGISLDWLIVILMIAFFAMIWFLFGEIGNM